MSLWQDIRFAARLLVKDRWFTLAAATALALGIAANTAVFTFVNAVLIRGLPFDHPDRVMFVNTQDTRGRTFGVAYLDFEDWRAASRTMAGFAAVLNSTINVSDEGRPPDQFQGAYVSGNLFSLIGQRPLLGRDFRAEDDVIGADPVVLIGYSAWQNRYGGDSSLIGRTIRANSLPVTVVGIMPPDMKFPNNTDVWVPRAQLPAETRDAKRDVRNFNAIGRLADGATVEQARAELTSISKRLAEEYPATNKDVTSRVVPYNDQVNGGPIRIVFLALMGAVAFVLLIACSNVANLLLARAAHRSREMSVRVSLGASRWRLVRQLLVESVLLALISGVAGIGLSIVGVRWFDAATSGAALGRPYWIKFTMDASVLGFFALVSLGTGILFGLAPAMHVSKTNVNEVLKEGGRSGTSGIRARRWTQALIVVELALTLVLLAGAGYMMRSFLTLYRMDVGVETSHVLMMRLYLPLTKYPQPEPRTALYQQIEERLRGIPAIQASTLATNVPLGGGFRRGVNVEGREPAASDRPPDVTMLVVGDSYFDTLGIKLVNGRPFSGADGLPGHETAIINRRFATLHFRGEDPIGKRIKLVSEPPATPAPTWATIVGIAPNIRQNGPQNLEPDAVAYVPYRNDPQRGMTLLLRAQGDPAALTPLVRNAIQAIEPDLPLFNVQTMDQNLAVQRWPFRVFGSMFVMFAFIALVLSAVGLYAVTAYSVTQRTQEIGIRMALGAQAGQVRWLILRRSLIQLAVGLMIGLPGAYGVGRLLGSLLVQMSPADPITLISIVAMLVLVSAAACYWPARRATQLDPVVALRNE
jgi:predicted permease